MQFMCRVNVCTSVAKRCVDTADEMKRNLLDNNKQLLSKHLMLLSLRVRAYLQRNPSYAKILESCDVYSVARLAIADGARTYNHTSLVCPRTSVLWYATLCSKRCNDSSVAKSMHLNVS